ncbi:hypothetical protein ATG_13520 [Desulfurococcaceae archaeon AG1]|jgi:SSS family solute:Na+ symporter|nr:hypothetical protein ATG_13520 [Desulfurococcaceae archaeon AG1]
MSGGELYLPLIAFFSAFMLASILLGEVARRRGALRSVEEYYLAGRTLSKIHFFFTYFATTYSAFMFVGLVGFTYLYGVGTLGFELIYLMGTAALLSLLAPRILEKARSLNLITPTQLIYAENGSRAARYIVSLTYLGFMIPYMSVQIIGPAVVLSFLGLPREIAILATLVTVFIYVFYGGLRGVMYTDILQGSFFLTIAFLFAAYLAPGLASSQPQLHTLPGGFGYWSLERFVSLTLPWIFFSITNPQVLQRIYMAKDRSELSRGILMFLIAGFTLTLLMVIAGLGASGIVRVDLRDPNQITPYLMVNVLPEWMALALALTVWVAALSTLDSILLTLSSVISVDILGRTSVRVGRYSVLGIILALGIFSYYTVAPVVILAVASSAALLYLVPIIMLTLFEKPSGKEVSLLTLTGFITYIILFILRNTAYPHPLDYASISSLLITSIIALIIYARKKTKSN